jgi:aspartate beta-hydroxylase
MIRGAVISVMKQGRFYERVMDAGPELDRVKRYLRTIEGIESGQPLLPLQNPTFLPVFPGLDCRPFHSRENDPVAEYLEQAAPLIKSEAAAIRQRAFGAKKGEVVTEGLWEVYPMWYMGVDLPQLTARVPKLKALVDALPRSAFLHPFGEALLSWQQPLTHLRRHCSVDALRKRYSVGVTVEDDCELRVGDTRQKWVEGKAIVFEDCFEHEAWNGPRERLVFIVDTWHPDLTPVEVEVLLAGLRKKEVRQILCHFRLVPELKHFLLHQFERQDNDPLFKKYWDDSMQIRLPVIENWGTWTTTTKFN